MDEYENNLVALTGTLAGRPELSHISRGERFFVFPLETRRLSGAADRINVVAREALLESVELTEGCAVSVVGSLRSFNSKKPEGPRLVITVFAREIELTCSPDRNSVRLRGTLCKAPNYRTTPLGREICDLMLAVNRSCGRSDYLPCICWGAAAREAAEWSVGDALSLSGRIQSRKYIKLTDGEALEKTAYEVSVSEISISGAEGSLSSSRRGLR